MAGASALLPRSRELDADAPGANPTAVAGCPTGRAPAVLRHQDHLHHVLRAGSRDARPDRTTHRVRDARRIGAVRDVVAPSGAPVLLQDGLVGPAAGCAAGRAGGQDAA